MAKTNDRSLTERGERAGPRGVNRRSLLAGAGALAGVGLLRSPAAVRAAEISVTSAGGARHGADLRGADVVVTAGRGHEARFGLMFKDLPTFQPPDELLISLADQMGEPTSVNPVDHDNPTIPAGFTYLGQFIDHDMTLDRTPLPQQQTDPRGLTNFDSPLFDLASVYGRGPGADPQLYEPGGSGRLRTPVNGNGVQDLPRRDDGSAVIGDGRNDENLILAQLHLAFLNFHNRCLTDGLAATFEDARRLTQWHFQWVIVHDYLVKVAGQGVVDRYLDAKGRVKREFYKPKNPHRPMMPIEYSVAAFRFGHSMVRAAYLLNVIDGSETIAPIFGAAGSDLRGSRPLPARLKVDWAHFFEVPRRQDAPRNASRRIDSKLSLPLFNLPSTVVRDPVTSLAQRNLIRGKRLGLPSGQAVAARMGVPVLNNDELGLPNPDNAGWSGQAPLWFYILRETEIRNQGLRLGAVGGRIVTETILGILDSQKDSYLQAKSFTPVPPIAASTGQFGIGDFIAFAQGGSS